MAATNQRTLTWRLFAAQDASVAVTHRLAVRRFVGLAVLFVAIGLVLYAGLYALAEQHVYRTSLRNRFFAVRTAQAAPYDFVLLGASHAMPFDFEDMNAKLEQITSSRILNLSFTGSGIVPNRLLMEYFLLEHQTRSVIYFVDSFAFYSAEWNEQRLADSRLFERAPLDLGLARLLLTDPATRGPGVMYVSGFPKINNPERFESDISEDEATRFHRTYRPLPQFDRQRLAYLYPQQQDAAVLNRYLAILEDLVRELRERGIRVVAIKPPVPHRWYQLLPGEQRFDQQITQLLSQYQAEFHDFSLVSNDEAFFYNADHLNQDGVSHFFEQQLGPLLASKRD